MRETAALSSILQSSHEHSEARELCDKEDLDMSAVTSTVHEVGYH